MWSPHVDEQKVGQPARSYQQQLCANTGCSLEGLPEAMKDRDWWQVRVREIRAAAWHDDDDDDDDEDNFKIFKFSDYES